MGGGNIPENAHPTESTLKGGGKLGDNSANQETDSWTKKFSNTEAGTFPTDKPIGPDAEELSGLLFEERKRKRSDNGGTSVRSIEVSKVIIDSGFSSRDYTESSSNSLAKLAQQASQSQ